MLAALLLNAAICGALSGPHHRYQARVVWLLPLLAAGLLLRPREAVSGSSARARASSSRISELVAHALQPPRASGATARPRRAAGAGAALAARPAVGGGSPRRRGDAGRAGASALP